MVTSINAGARLDRLPISSFHYRIFWLIAAGMFFDGYDLYIAGPVLGAAAATKFSTLAQKRLVPVADLRRDDLGLADGFVPLESDRRPLPDPATSFANSRYFRPVRPKRPASTSGTRSSNSLPSSSQSVSAVNRRPLPEEPRGFAALGAYTGT
jgi:hypothetical protein